LLGDSRGDRRRVSQPREDGMIAASNVRVLADYGAPVAADWFETTKCRRNHVFSPPVSWLLKQAESALDKGYHSITLPHRFRGIRV